MSYSGDIENTINCRYECYNGMVQNNISTVLGILAEVIQQLRKENPEHPELIHLMQARGILQDAFEINGKGWAMHHGGTVEVELSERGDQVAR